MKNGSIFNSCGTIPILNLLCFWFLSISSPQIFTSPEFFFTNPPKMFINVDFPAPFGPNKPWIEPFLILILKLFYALTSVDFFLNILLTFLASIE